MKIFTLLIILCLASVVGAEDFKTIEGKEYKNVTVKRIEPDGIVLSSSSGISKVYFTELPKEVQERFHYDAEKGDEYSRKQNEEQKQREDQRQWPVYRYRTVQALHARYNELQHQEDNLVRRIQESEQLPKYLS